MDFNIVRNAKVEAGYGSKTDNGFPMLAIIVADGDNEYYHEFEKNDKVNGLLMQMDLNTISKLFTGGTYFFYKGVLRDFRLGDYRGFIHSDDAMKQLNEKIGVTVYDKPTHIGQGSNVNALFNRVRARKNNGVHLGGEWDKFDFSIDEMGNGGDFNNRLIYNYSLFSPNITTSLEVERLVCTNGMVSMSPLVSYETPVISDWEDNLNVLSCQLKPKITEVLRDRVKAMSQQRASIREMKDAHDVLDQRLRDSKSALETARLEEMMRLTDVEKNLAMHYREEVFKNKKQDRYLESDLTQFDVYNILTEASSHTYGDENSDNRIQRLSSNMMFDGVRREKAVSPKIPESVHSDPNRAFFGES